MLRCSIKNVGKYKLHAKYAKYAKYAAKYAC